MLLLEGRVLRIRCRVYLGLRRAMSPASSREDWLSLRSDLQVSASVWLKRLCSTVVSAAALAAVC